MATNPMTITATQLGQQLAATLVSIAAAQNKAAVAAYNAAVAAGQTPVPPMLTLVDQQAVINLEVEANTLFQSGGDVSKLDWSTVYSQIQYIPIPVPAQAPAQLVLSSEQVPGYPGFYQATSGDGASTPAGTKVELNGHEYIKRIFGSFGSAMWQQMN